MRINHLHTYLMLFCTAVLIVISGCSKEPESEDFINITDQFEVQLHQQLSPTGGLPSLYVKSIEPQECSNSYISYQTIISEDKIKLILNDILTEGECETGGGIVSEEVLIQNVNESLQIEINLKGIIENKGRLITEEKEFDLRLYQFDGLKISRTNIKKVLPNMLWGTYKLSDKDLELQLESYLNNIDTNDARVKGDYGYFYLAPDNTVAVYGEDDDYVTFLISNSEDLAEIESKILEFKQSDPSLVFHATNYDGSSLNIE